MQQYFWERHEKSAFYRLAGLRLAEMRLEEDGSWSWQAIRSDPTDAPNSGRAATFFQAMSQVNQHSWYNEARPFWLFLDRFERDQPDLFNQLNLEVCDHVLTVVRALLPLTLNNDTRASALTALVCATCHDPRTAELFLSHTIKAFIENEADMRIDVLEMLQGFLRTISIGDSSSGSGPVEQMRLAIDQAPGDANKLAICLLGMLDDHRVEVRLGSLGMLPIFVGETLDQIEDAVIRHMLEEPSSAVVAKALAGLRNQAGSRAMPAVIEILRKPEAAIQQAACEWLSKRGSAALEAVPHLLV